VRSLVALVVLAASPARADERAEVALVWNRGHGTESCLDEAELRARVEARLARSVFASDAAYEVSAELGRDASAFTATLTLTGARAA
jgi:hypothetical protein